MERLTERFSNGQAAVRGCGENCIYDYKYCKNYVDECPTISEIFDKLAGYEDEEEGRRVGIVLMDTVQNGENSFVNIYKTVNIYLPDDGRSWNIVGQTEDTYM